MKKPGEITRRKFMSAAGIVTAGLASGFGKIDVSSYVKTLPAELKLSEKYPLRLFSKPLDAYDFGFMCDCVSRCGIGGFDLTVRPGGKVEPGKVETDLPRYVAEAKKSNLALDMIVTSILSASDQFTERILKTASASGVGYYRFGWASYDLNAGIMQSIKKFHDELVRLTELNRKYKLAGSYQNHEGVQIGGPVWDLYEMLLDLPKEFTGVQYDVRHAKVEGDNTWILGMRLIAEKINTLAIKDFTWKINKGKPEAVTVPLGEGMIDWDRYFTMIRDLKIEAPITLHIEYPLLEKGEEKLSPAQQQDIIVKKIKKDADFVKTYLAKYQLA